MTCKEAHKFLEIKQREMTIKRHLYSNEQAIEINGLAIEALEKQIPKEPLNIEETKYKVSYKCPVCGTVHVNGWCGTNWKLPFCSICGQALDWSDSK